ncbi:MAG: tetratricopeptide repeat protein [Polyangiaceae bacterium]
MRASLPIFLFAFGLATAAHAEDYPPCENTPSASDVDAAKGMHKAAEQYYARARYEKAIASWREAYGFDCTAHRLLINIGNAYEKLGDTAEAIEAFETYIERTGSAADPTIVEKVDNLRAQLPRTPEPPPPPPPPPPPAPPGGETDAGGPGIGPWLVVGGGAAAAVVGGVLLGIGIQKEKAAEEACPSRTNCAPEVRQEGNLGINLQRGGGVALTVGLVAVAGGFVWWAVANALEDDATKAPQAALQLGPVSVRPDLLLAPGLGALGLSGRF